jgi:hypothetical protein
MGDRGAIDQKGSEVHPVRRPLVRGPQVIAPETWASGDADHGSGGDALDFGQSPESPHEQEETTRHHSLSEHDRIFLSIGLLQLRNLGVART